MEEFIISKLKEMSAIFGAGFEQPDRILSHWIAFFPVT